MLLLLSFPGPVSDGRLLLVSEHNAVLPKDISRVSAVPNMSSGCKS